MNDKPLQFLATPSATVPNTWIGIVVETSTGRVLAQTLVPYRHPHQARFGARRKWAEWVRVQQGLTGNAA